jgi:hypothetical protein
MLAIVACVPVLSDIDADSLVPDIHDFPAFSADAPSISLSQRCQFLGALEILLDSYLGTSLPGFEEELERPIMPRMGLACIAAQISALCEHLVLLRSLEPDAHFELDTIKGGETNPPLGSKQRILEEIQTVRQKNFDLEMRLATNGKIVDAWATRGKIEADKRYQRLLQLNSLLEEKLKQRTDEHKLVVQESQNQSRRADHSLWLVEEKEAQNDKLKAEMDKCYAMQDDLLKREKDYGRKTLEASFAECDKTLRHEVRVQRLEEMMNKSIQGGQDVNGGQDTSQGRSHAETDLTRMIAQASNKVMEEFEALFDARQKSIEEYVEKLELSRAHLQRPEMTFEEFCKIRDSFMPQRRAAAVQTDAPSMKFHGSVSERAPSPGGVPWSKRLASVSSAGGTPSFNQVLPPNDGAITYRSGHNPAHQTGIRPYVPAHGRVFGARGLAPLPTCSRAGKGVVVPARVVSRDVAPLSNAVEPEREASSLPAVSWSRHPPAEETDGPQEPRPETQIRESPT